MAKKGFVLKTQDDCSLLRQLLKNECQAFKGEKSLIISKYMEITIDRTQHMFL